MCSRQQHAVAEHVARHVADADHGERLGLDVDAHLAEVALDRLPGAAGGDAHRLVVVADAPPRRRRRPARSRARARCRWRCRRRSRCPCRRRPRDRDRRRRGAPRPAGGTTLPPTQIVGDVEQRLDEHPVAGACPRPGWPRGRPRGRRSVAGSCLGRSRPWRPTGTITAFLTCCAFTRPSISVRKSSRRSRPAQAAARDVAEAQVHALDRGE